MSADNGIYILMTKGTNGRLEYRVAHAQGIENIYYDFNWSPDNHDSGPYLPPGEWCNEIVKEYFGRCRVFNNKYDANDYAYNKSKEYDVLEYGICLLDYSHLTFPE